MPSEKVRRPSPEDLRAALKEIGVYVDVTEEDLLKIYDLALRHAEGRLRGARRVSEVMTKEVVCAAESATLASIAALLSAHNISGLPVVDENRRVVGVVSEADVLSAVGLSGGRSFRGILRHLTGEPLPRKKTGDTASDIMTSPAITIGPDEDIKTAAGRLDERRIKRLPVVDAGGILVGIVSRADLVRAMKETGTVQGG